MTSRYEAMLSTERMQTDAVVIAAQTLITAAVQQQLMKEVDVGAVVMIEIGITYLDPETGLYVKIGGCVPQDVYRESLAAVVKNSLAQQEVQA